MKCLLCEAAAVADALCVPCGAKLWAAKEWLRDSEHVRRVLWRELGNPKSERVQAIQDLASYAGAQAFLARLDAAKAARAAQESRNARERDGKW